MRQNHTITSGRNAMSKSGILSVCFDTFSSKNEYRVTFINNYNQSCSIDFRRCSFTGKERDEETGYGYFGARYMDHELMTMWLSVDPMADKYPGISPYNYCVWNPIKLVDPDGNEAWKPDENRNLVAEKGDNAWTLATYLNTTPEIATNMLEEQGYSVNSKGVLNLREGDVFEIDHGTIEAHSDIDLGKTGNFIRQKAGSGIAKDLFTNFWNGEGDITLTGSQFAGILMYIKESNQSPTESDSKSKLINFSRFWKCNCYSRWKAKNNRFQRYL